MARWAFGRSDGLVCLSDVGLIRKSEFMHKHAHKTSVFKSHRTRPPCCVCDIHIKHSVIATMCPIDTHTHTLNDSLSVVLCASRGDVCVCLCCFLALLPRTNSPVACSYGGKTHNNKSHTSSHTCHSPSAGMSGVCVCVFGVSVSGLGMRNTPSPLL